jgi:hypothetical protein
MSIPSFAFRVSFTLQSSLPVSWSSANADVVVAP